MFVFMMRANGSDESWARLNKGSKLSASMANVAGTTSTLLWIYQPSLTVTFSSVMEAGFCFIVTILAVSWISHPGTACHPCSICSALHSHVEIWMALKLLSSPLPRKLSWTKRGVRLVSGGEWVVILLSKCERNCSVVFVLQVVFSTRVQWCLSVGDSNTSCPPGSLAH